MADAEKQMADENNQASSILRKSNRKGKTPEDSNTKDLNGADNVFGSRPIADLFPETTLMFSDLVGFTAWSSVREPSQVFTLLETVYHCFDEIAKKRRVFKVETVGDCYVAAAGYVVLTFFQG